MGEETTLDSVLFLCLELGHGKPLAFNKEVAKYLRKIEIESIRGKGSSVAGKKYSLELAQT